MIEILSINLQIVILENSLLEKSSKKSGWS